MFNRDKITESFGKESLGTPMKIIVLVSSAHIPMKARGIVRSVLGDNEILESHLDNVAIPQFIITDILVRELGFFSVLKDKNSNKDKHLINSAPTSLKGLQLRFEAESARAKLTYVREFYTLGAMNRIRKSKPDLIIDISDGAEVHEIILEHSTQGVLTVINDVQRSSLRAIQRSTNGNHTLLERPYTPEKLRQAERIILLESIVLIGSGK